MALFLCALAILIPDALAGIDGCVADADGAQSCHQEVPLDDATSLFQIRNLKMTDREQSSDDFATDRLWVAEAEKDDASQKTLKKAAALCDPLLVAEVCTKWNEVDMEYGSRADKNSSVVHKYELAEHFVVQQDSVAEFLRSIGAANVETDQDALSRGAFAVTCMDLCRKVLQSIPEDQQPPSPDLGCYWPSRGGEMKCDIDVSEEAFSKIQFRDYNKHPEEEARHYAEDRKAPPSDDQAKALPSNHQATTDDKLLHGEPPRTDAERRRLEELRQPHRSVDELRINIANLFGIYPPTKINVEVKSNLSDAAWSAIELSEEKQMDTMDKLKKLAVKGKAYSQKVLDKMDQKAAAKHVITWFGNNGEKTRKEIRRVISGLVAMLDNVDFVYPGSTCEKGDYAYVFPTCSWCESGSENSKGQKIFYICPLTMKSDEGVQIETMTHEGSHHLTMETDDVKTNGLGAYGRSTCKQRAKIDPKGALKNADNFCYFINDVAWVPPPCKGDAATWKSADYPLSAPDCESAVKNGWCDDKGADGLSAEEVCPGCKKCQAGQAPAPPTPAPPTPAPPTPAAPACKGDAATWKSADYPLSTPDCESAVKQGYCDDKGADGLHAKEVCPGCKKCQAGLPTCEGSSAAFDAGYGGCLTYATTNANFCSSDVDKTTGALAERVCPQCGKCK